jgi:hypothetical protein
MSGFRMGTVTDSTRSCLSLEWKQLLIAHSGLALEWKQLLLAQGDIWLQNGNNFCYLEDYTKYINALCGINC